MTTSLICSVWHGIPGGSYVTLVLAGFIAVLSRLCRTNIRPIFLPAPGISESPSAFKYGYDITGTILTILCLNYVSAPFFLGGIRDTLQVWQATDWYGFWLIFGGLAFFYSGSRKALKSFHPSHVAEADTMKGRQSTMLDQIPGGVPPIDAAVKEAERKLG